MNELLQFLKDKKILILGFGLEGQSTYKLIRKHFPNKMIYLADKEANFCEKYDFICDDQNVISLSGEHYLENLEDYDLIIKSPGISFKHMDIHLFEDKLTSQLELLLEFFPVNTIGVTGTKGKSTTSSLIYHILLEQNIHTLLLGNIGVPIFDYIDVLKEDMTIVLEMSSHQLEYTKRSPHIAILLNIYEEHLDHYNSIKSYMDAKFHITEYQNQNDYFIYDMDNEFIHHSIENGKLLPAQNFMITSENHHQHHTIYMNQDVIYYGDTVLYDTREDRKLLGKHNVHNIMFALAVGEILHLDLERTVHTISHFEPLSHRMEFVGEFNGIRYYNDSIATIPEATISCIDALQDVNTLIIGGMDRGIDFTSFVEYLSSGVVENIICMPSTGTSIGNKLLDRHDRNVAIYEVENLKEAVETAKKVTQKGAICVLSPAAASYGYYKNFQERGEEFKRFVKES